MSRLTRDGTAGLVSETTFLGTNGDRKKINCPVQLTTSRIANLTRSIITLAICDEYTYIHIVESMRVA